MTASVFNGGILLVASERELRRELFDVLDAQGHPPIHSARDTTHAAILLEGREPLALIVVAFDGDGRSSLTLCEQLRLLPPCTDAPILAVLVDDATIKPTQLPAVVSGWLYASQVGAELISCWHQLQGDKPEAAEEKPASKAVIASPARPSGGDYRFVFEDGDGDWLIIDPLAQRVVEASPAYMRHSGLANSVLTSLGLSEVLSFESVSMDKAFADADRRWLAAQR